MPLGKIRHGEGREVWHFFMQILVDEAEEGQRPDGELLRAREGRAASLEARGLRGRRCRNRGSRRPFQQLEAAGGLGKMTSAGILCLSGHSKTRKKS